MVNSGMPGPELAMPWKRQGKDAETENRTAGFYAWVGRNKALRAGSGNTPNTLASRSRQRA